MVLRDAVEGISGADGPWLVQLATLFEQNCATLPGGLLIYAAYHGWSALKHASQMRRFPEILKHALEIREIQNFPLSMP